MSFQSTDFFNLTVFFHAQFHTYAWSRFSLFCFPYRCLQLSGRYPPILSNKSLDPSASRLNSLWSPDSVVIYFYICRHPFLVTPQPTANWLLFYATLLTCLSEVTGDLPMAEPASTPSLLLLSCCPDVLLGYHHCHFWVFPSCNLSSTGPSHDLSRYCDAQNHIFYFIFYAKKNTQSS